MAHTCIQCGACCETIPLLLTGKPCEHYDPDTHLCKIYETRPDICRIDKCEELFGPVDQPCEMCRLVRDKIRS